jgi:hypothetical protein
MSDEFLSEEDLALKDLSQAELYVFRKSAKALL